MTNVYTPPGNMLVTQAVISVPVGADGVSPVSPINLPVLPAGADANARAQIELMRSINDRLGALLILLTNAYGLSDTPESVLAAAAQSELRIS